jgi:hypothetical protein
MAITATMLKMLKIPLEFDVLNGRTFHVVNNGDCGLHILKIRVFSTVG